MKDRYLEVTFRKGKPLAAYLYLPRKTGQRSARTREMAPGLRVDFAPDGSAIGIEIGSPALLKLGDLNSVLDQLGLPRIPASEIAPLRAA